MPKLPVISGPEAVKAFQKAGWTLRRLGPHLILTKEGSKDHLSVPNHRVLDRGTLRSLIRLSGLSVEEFINLL
jgi:predicted RNA binding protein YcfA (HicA-like mRNA interferase family)